MKSKDRGRGGRFGWRVLLLAAMIAVGGAFAASPAAAQPPSAAQEGFVPLDQLPAEEQLPAAPLVIGAYAIAWVAVFVYLWSIWQRTARVERDLVELSRRVGAGGPR